MPRSYEEARARDQAAADERRRRTELIRDLNDRFRRTLQGGLVVMTPGVRGLGSHGLSAAVDAIRTFSTFDADNDPWDEHDFGAVEVVGERVFWKIDCYDKALECGSPDATDAAVTMRVLTVMLAGEY